MLDQAQPFFSIIIPTYNRANFIEKTINSVLQQSSSDFEIIVVDDGSTDNTEDLIGALTDPRIHYFKKENEERGRARNYGGELAKGRYVYFLDSDDILYPNHLAVAHDFINSKNPDIFFQQYELIDENGQLVPTYLPKNDPINIELLKKGNFLSCHGVFMKSEVFLSNKFREDRDLAGSEDYELWLRMAARLPIYYSGTVSSALILHDERSVLNFDAQALVLRKKKMLEYLFSDKVFMSKYDSFKNILKSNAYSYISLHLSISKETTLAFKYFLLSWRHSFSFPLKKRFWSILKRLIMRH